MNPTEEFGREEPPVLDVVLQENCEEIKTVACNEPENTNNGVEAVKPAEKKPRVKPKKAKINNVAKTKGKSTVSMKKKKVLRNLHLNQARLFKDLNAFAGSVINELKVARENMFAEMKKELMALAGGRETTALCANKNKTALQNGTESNVNPQNHSEVSIDKAMKSVVVSDVLKNLKAGELAAKPVQATELLMTNNQPRGRLPLNRYADQLLQYSARLPAVVPNPQGIRFNGGGPVLAPKDKADGLNSKQRDPWNFYQGVPVSHGRRFPTPTHQGQGIGSSIMGGSDISTQTYSGAAIQNHGRLGVAAMSARFPGVSALSPEDVLRSYLTNNVLQRNGGGLARPQSLVMKDDDLPKLYQFPE